MLHTIVLTEMNMWSDRLFLFMMHYAEHIKQPAFAM